MDSGGLKGVGHLIKSVEEKTTEKPSSGRLIRVAVS